MLLELVKEVKQCERSTFLVIRIPFNEYKIHCGNREMKHKPKAPKGAFSLRQFLDLFFGDERIYELLTTCLGHLPP